MGVKHPILRGILFLVLGAVSISGVRAAGLPTAEALHSAAEAGDPWAQLNLGAAYDHGLAGIPRDPRQAVIWYRRAAEQGLAKAQFNLAHCLVTGCDGHTDPAEARHWMRRAAAQHMADAQFLYGVMLAEGLGGAVDRTEARHWLQRAASVGQADAAEYLARLGD